MKSPPVKLVLFFLIGVAVSIGTACSSDEVLTLPVSVETLKSASTSIRLRVRIGGCETQSPIDNSFQDREWELAAAAMNLLGRIDDGLRVIVTEEVIEEVRASSEMIHIELSPALQVRLRPGTPVIDLGRATFALSGKWGTGRWTFFLYDVIAESWIPCVWTSPTDREREKLTAMVCDLEDAAATSTDP